MKKAIILYDSLYGNTKKVAMSLTRGLESGGVYVDVIPIQEFKISEINNYKLIAIGGPTHFHGASKQMKSFLSKIKHLRLKNKLGFAFETKADFKFSGSAAKHIVRSLKKMKIRLIQPIITGIILNKEGPLEDSTSSSMEQIGLIISEKMNSEVN
jgi:flavorubredoxin